MPMPSMAPELGVRGDGRDVERCSCDKHAHRAYRESEGRDDRHPGGEMELKPMIRMTSAAASSTSSAGHGGSVSYSRTGSPVKSICRLSEQSASPNSGRCRYWRGSDRWRVCHSRPGPTPCGRPEKCCRGALGQSDEGDFVDAGGVSDELGDRHLRLVVAGAASLSVENGDDLRPGACWKPLGEEIEGVLPTQCPGQ